jgi:hypothetical protein
LRQALDRAHAAMQALQALHRGPDLANLADLAR